MNAQLDMELMNEASSILKEYNDFEAFSRVKTDVNHFRCIISEAGWVRDDHHLTFIIRSDRFLRGMVRAIVGTMIEIGQHRVTIDEFRAVIESKDRREARTAVPPHGLYLVNVEYPDSIFAITH